MATRFTQIVAAIEAQLAVNWEGNGVVFAEGILARKEHKAPNRVVWVRAGGRTEQVDGIGPGIHDSEVSPGTDVASSAILTDVYDVECDVWGSDEEVADRIRVAIIRAAHNASSNRSIESGRWRDLTQEEDIAGHMNHGAKHRIEFVFRVPILDEQEVALALIEDDETSVDFVDKPTFDTTVTNLDLDGPP